MTGANTSEPDPGGNDSPVVLRVETGGNQPYIFATNKLRENVGASQLLYSTGTNWLIESLLGEGLLPAGRLPDRPDGLRALLLDPARNPSLHSPASRGAEIVNAASGKAIIRFARRADALKVATHISRRALEEAPGMELGCGIAAVQAGTGLVGAIRCAGDARAEQLSNHPGPAARHLRLPPIMDCATSGYPAALWDEDKNEPGARSAMSWAKRTARRDAIKRLFAMADRPEPGDPGKTMNEIEDAFDRLGERQGWLAVIHADGNGIGRLFRALAAAYERRSQSADEYAGKLRGFSVALDSVAELAYRSALEEVDPIVTGRKRPLLPVVPLVLGGDDLTAVADGAVAFRFTLRYLREFEDRTARLVESGHIPEEVATHVMAGRLSACAGIAFVKPHYPFFEAYRLCEQLADRAKDAMRELPTPLSLVDFHVLYDASGSDLDRIRAELAVPGGLLHMRPYVASELGWLASVLNNDPALAWAKAHHIDVLESRIKLLDKKDESGRRLLSRSQIGELRRRLSDGVATADGALALVRDRHPELKRLESQERSLFTDPIALDATLATREELMRVGTSDVRRSWLLDMLDAAEVWPQ